LFIGKKLNVPGQYDISYAALMVLKVISDFPEGGYGYNLMQTLTKKYNWAAKSGTVYPILKRLLEKKYVKQQQGASRKKIYIITPRGYELLKSLETELKIIESRTSPEGWTIDTIIDKLRDRCEFLTNKAKNPDESTHARQELYSIREKIVAFIEILDKYMQALK